jgi:polyhydroxyalkanoate synthesis regulator phasin
MPDSQKPVATAPPAPAVAVAGAGVTPPVPPKRSPGHRGADVKDTVAEMAAKAHEISLEAGSKMAAAMKDVIGAAAGLTGLVLESARDLLQYMVRRGQMTQDEADKLMREVEASHAKRKPAATAASPASPVRAATPATPASPAASSHTPPRPTPPRPTPAVVVPAAKPATSTKHSAPPAAAKKAAVKKPTMKPAAKKHPVKAAAKPKAKASAKTAKRR